MGSSARLTSIEILQTIAAALKKFDAECSSSMDDLDIELHRALEWIHHDRKEYWARELRSSQDRVAEARVQLLQAQTARRVGDYRPSCVDEQKALERAKRRMATAEQKIVTVRRCATAIERAVNDCQRARNQFVTWLDSDVEKAIAALNRMSDSLDHYVALQTPTLPTTMAAMPASAARENSLELESAKSAGPPPVVSPPSADAAPSETQPPSSPPDAADATAADAHGESEIAATIVTAPSAAASSAETDGNAAEPAKERKESPS
jgi:hypothetical protein